jgi:hypothetical protein
MDRSFEQWYDCRACGERRRFPFEANADDPGCRCPPAPVDRQTDDSKDEAAELVVS